MDAREMQKEIYETIRIITEEIARKEIREYIKTLDLDKMVREELIRKGVNSFRF